MTPINAIAKVRFNSARPQRVHLIEEEAESADLLCLEAGQQMSLPDGKVMLYVITGTATVGDGGEQATAATGNLLPIDSSCTLANRQEQRLVCLAITCQT